MIDLLLFGATGDLSRRKLIPSIARVSQYKPIRLIAAGRKPLSNEDFRIYIEKIAQEHGLSFKNAIGGFEAIYSCLELDSIKGYCGLKKLLRHQTKVYLAVPPALQMPIFRRLVDSGILNIKNNNSVAFEKPFGINLKDAQELHQFARKNVREDQILRVDHYAGKETILDIESAGRIGLPAFIASKRKIKEIHINFKEKITVDTRGDFYDSVGALVDIGQNHMLHMLTTMLTAFSEQCIFQSGSLEGTCLISTSLTSSLNTIRAIISDSLELFPDVTLGQYIGFQDISGVKKDSKTETYFKYRLKLKNPISKLKNIKTQNKQKITSAVKNLFTYFRDAIFVFEGGKGLSKDDVSINVLFKDATAYKVMINRNCGREAYDEIFYALIEGNANRFVPQSQVETGWRIVEKIKSKKIKKMVKYSVGSDPQI